MINLPPQSAHEAAAPEPVLIDAAEVARLLTTSTKTVRRWDSAGKLPRPIRLSRGTIRWRYAEILDWAAAGCPGRKEWEALQAADSGRRK